MRLIEQIHEDIERLSEERKELWHKLSAGHDPSVREEIRALDAKLDSLWQEQRVLRAQLRFGDREKIVARRRAARARSLTTLPRGNSAEGSARPRAGPILYSCRSPDSRLFSGR